MNRTWIIFICICLGALILLIELTVPVDSGTESDSADSDIDASHQKDMDETEPVEAVSPPERGDDLTVSSARNAWEYLYGNICHYHTALHESRVFILTRDRLPAFYQQPVPVNVKTRPQRLGRNLDVRIRLKIKKGV